MVDKISYFNVKVKSPHKDVVVVKGNADECDPILLEGSVKLSLTSNIHVKKIKLSLVGEISISFFQRDQNGGIKDQYFEKYVTLKVDWDNLLINEEGVIAVGSYGDVPIKTYKLKKLAPAVKERPGLQKTRSTSFLPDGDHLSLQLPKSGLDGTPFKNQSSNHSFLLPKGNYSLPFKVVLPTNICETVEGLTIGRHLYKFEYSIQKGIFDKPITKFRYLRILRTLHPTSLNLVDNVDISNTWPGKVEYQVSLNRKGIAIGSTIPVKILIVPLIKGLRLKKVTVEIVQHHHVGYLEAKSPEYEQVFGTQEVIGRLDDATCMSDHWDVTGQFKVPNNIKDITPSCLLNHELVQVRHRLRVVIQLKNPGGHISELRANLPVTLYISDHIGHVYGHHFDIEPVHGTLNIVKNSDEPIFKHDKTISNGNSRVNSRINTPLVSPNISSIDLSSAFNCDEEDELEDLMAPPIYEQAKFDKIYDINSPKSPIEQLGSSYFDLPKNKSQLSMSKTPDGAITPSLDLQALSRVPSYTQAVENDDDEEGNYDAAPTYDIAFPNSSGTAYSLPKSMSFGQLSMSLDKHAANLHEQLSRSFNNSAVNLLSGAIPTTPSPLAGQNTGPATVPTFEIPSGSSSGPPSGLSSHSRSKSSLRLHLPMKKKK